MDCPEEKNKWWKIPITSRKNANRNQKAFERIINKNFEDNISC